MLVSSAVFHPDEESANYFKLAAARSRALLRFTIAIGTLVTFFDIISTQWTPPLDPIQRNYWMFLLAFKEFMYYRWALSLDFEISFPRFGEGDNLGLYLWELHLGCGSGLCAALFIRVFLVLLPRVLLQAVISFVCFPVFVTLMSTLGNFVLLLVLVSFLFWWIPVDCCMRSEADCCFPACKYSSVILCKALQAMVLIFFFTWVWIGDYYQTIIFEYRQPFSGHIVYWWFVADVFCPVLEDAVELLVLALYLSWKGLISFVAMLRQRQVRQHPLLQPAAEPLLSDSVVVNIHHRAGITSADPTHSWEILLARVAPERSSTTVPA
eukprot:g71441.t1